MPLPKGTFKGLAKVAGPVLLWMTAGWALYPWMIEHITLAMDETADMGEIRLFSMAMVITCIVSGIALLMYGFTGRQPSEDEMKASEPRLCPYCGQAMAANVCPRCGKSMMK